MVHEAKRHVSRAEVGAALGVNEDFLLTLEREQIIVCQDDGYDVHTVERIRICRTLHEELGVNLAGLEVALNLLDTIEGERRQFEEVLAWVRERLAAGDR